MGGSTSLQAATGRNSWAARLESQCSVRRPCVRTGAPPGATPGFARLSMDGWERGGEAGVAMAAKPAPMSDSPE